MLALALVLALPLASAVALGVATAPPAAAAVGYAGIVVNEVQANGSPDWIEITNTSGAPIDVSGVKILDDNDAHGYQVVPDGTIVAPGALVTVDSTVNGLGNGGDAVRLYAPDAPSPPSATPTIDSYAWAASAGAGRSFGRCPDGLGAVVVTVAETKGAQNSCATKPIAINEVESNGDATHGDWIEVRNNSAASIDISGWTVLDNDDAHTPKPFPAGSVVAAGGYLALTTDSGSPSFGLGGADQARLFDDVGTLVDAYAWSAHATVTYARCPDGTGPFVSSSVSTYQGANDCTPPLKINEIESSGGTPGDWIELVNIGATSFDASGYVLTDDDPTHTYVIPAATSVPAGGYLVVEEADLGFGLGQPDAARLLAPDGTTVIDSYAWTTHATTTYGRCPDGKGAFTTTQTPSKGALDVCPGDLVTSAWPGGQSVATVDETGAFGTNLSGLVYQGSGSTTRGTLWAVKNGPSTLYRLTWNGTSWVPAAGDWAAGKTLNYPDGSGDPDAEGVTYAAGDPSAGIFVSTERDNDNSGVSRPAIVKFLPDASGTSLDAVRDWDLTADLPTFGANLGLEGVTWVPDTYLTAQGFVDDSTGSAYTPSSYPDHGTGLFFTTAEQNGMVYGYALDQSADTFHRVTSFASGFVAAMDLHWNAERRRLWVVCDDTCQGRTATFTVQGGHFTADAYYERPTGMDNLNNEGFTIAARDECVGGVEPVYYSDDTGTDAHALREGTISCAPPAAQTVTFTSTPPAGAVVGQTYAVSASGGPSGNPVSFASTTPAVCSVSGGPASVDLVGPGTCVLTATQAGNADYLADSAGQSLDVVKAATSVALTTSATTLTATVSVTAPGSATVTGDVVFLADDTYLGTAPVVDGVAELDAVVEPGSTRAVEAQYGGSTLLRTSRATLDRADPRITAEVTSDAPPSASGWYAGPVTVTFTCAPQGSPLVGTCPDPVVLDTSGADQSVTGTVAAADGGVGSVTVDDLDLDLVAPAVRIAGVRAGATYRADRPAPRCVGTDPLSGVATCVVSSTRRGLVVVVRAAAVDAAGNEATVVTRYRVPRLRVVGARFAGGRYLVERGRAYTLEALLGAGAGPRLAGPVPQGSPIRGAGRIMKAHLREGSPAWTGRLPARGGRRGQLWKAGVRVGKKTLRVRLEIVG